MTHVHYSILIGVFFAFVAYMIFDSLWAPIIVGFFGYLKSIDGPCDPKDYFEEE